MQGLQTHYPFVLSFFILSLQRQKAKMLMTIMDDQLNNSRIKLKAGEYVFSCNPMPWTEIDMGVKFGTIEMFIPVWLSVEEIQGLIDMYRWAWDSNWFENSYSEMVCTELMKERMPQLYKRIYPLVHNAFCEKFSTDTQLRGFGDYEIFIPDEIDDLARRN